MGDRLGSPLGVTGFLMNHWAWGTAWEALWVLLALVSARWTFREEQKSLLMRST